MFTIRKFVDYQIERLDKSINHTDNREWRHHHQLWDEIRRLRGTVKMLMDELGYEIQHIDEHDRIVPKKRG